MKNFSNTMTYKMLYYTIAVLISYFTATNTQQNSTTSESRKFELDNDVMNVYIHLNPCEKTRNLFIFTTFEVNLIRKP